MTPTRYGVGVISFSDERGERRAPSVERHDTVVPPRRERPGRVGGRQCTSRALRPHRKNDPDLTEPVPGTVTTCPRLRVDLTPARMEKRTGTRTGPGALKSPRPSGSRLPHAGVPLGVCGSCSNRGAGLARLIMRPTSTLSERSRHSRPPTSGRALGDSTPSFPIRPARSPNGCR